MRLFRKNKVSDQTDLFAFADSIAEANLAEKKDTRYEEYIKYAHELPLLTDEELRRFAVEGKSTIVSEDGLGVSWMSPLNTQFLIRLRRTLMDKFPDVKEDENEPPPNLELPIQKSR